MKRGLQNHNGLVESVVFGQVVAAIEKVKEKFLFPVKERDVQHLKVLEVQETMADTK